MLEVTVREALLALPSLENIGRQNLPQKAAWRIGRWTDKLRPLVDRYGKQRNEIIRKHGAPNKDGMHEVKKSAEAQEGFEKEHDDLLDEKEELSYDPIPLSLFKRKVKNQDGAEKEEEIELSGTDLGRAMKFFSES